MSGGEGLDLSRPCEACIKGQHDQCGGVCGCIADHQGDEAMMRGFKRLKREMHPEREAWTAGGWKREPIRVTAEVGQRRAEPAPPVVAS